MELVKIDIPNEFKIVKNELYNYDINTDSNIDNRYKYLQEDILQITLSNLTIDIGWYGDLEHGKGCFKIFLVKNQNWDSIIETLSADTISQVCISVYPCH